MGTPHRDGDVGPGRQGQLGPQRRPREHREHREQGPKQRVWLRPGLWPLMLLPMVRSTQEPRGTAEGQVAVGQDQLCATKQRGAGTARDQRPAKQKPDQWDEMSGGHPLSFPQADKQQQTPQI